MTSSCTALVRIALLSCLVGTATLALAQLRSAAPEQRASAPVRGDYIVAVVNQTPITNGDVQRRLERIAGEAQARGQRLPPRGELLPQVLEQLIDERAQLDHARELGLQLESGTVDRAVEAIAARNQMTIEQLAQQIRLEGLDYQVFRDQVRDELLLQRLREREVQARIRVSEADISDYLERQAREADPNAVVYTLSHILVAVPERASANERAQRRALADELRARAQKGEAFDALARAHSDAPEKSEGGALGPRRADRLPALFVRAVQDLAIGAVSPVLTSGAGYHILRLDDRSDPTRMVMPQTRTRHILLRSDSDLSEAQRLDRLRDFRRRIVSGQASFEQLARDFSDDGSASGGGDLGWAVPGQFVPEFEQVMNQLAPGQISEPFVSRFGAHLVQVVERREVELDALQRRQVARNILREERFESTYLDWARELRDRAYVERREPPQ